MPLATAEQKILFGDQHGHGSVALSPNERYLYTNNYPRRFVSRVNLAQEIRARTCRSGSCPLKFGPESLGITPDGRRLVVPFGNDGRTVDLDNDGIAIIDVVDGRFTLLDQVSLDDEPTAYNIAFSVDSELAYVLTKPRKSSRDLLEVSLSPPYRVARKLPFPSRELSGLAVSTTLNRGYVSDAGHRTIHVVDLRKVAGRVIA